MLSWCVPGHACWPRLHEVLVVQALRRAVSGHGRASVWVCVSVWSIVQGQHALLQHMEVWKLPRNLLPPRCV